MSGGVITRRGEKENQQLNNELLLKYFRENDIKEISLTPEGNLLIKYNSDQTKIITSDQTNQELQKVIIYCQENNQTNLSQQDLINKTNSPTTKSENSNNLLAIIGIGGALIIGVVIGLWKSTTISTPTEEKKIIQKRLSKNGSMRFNFILSFSDNLGLAVEVVAIRRNLDKSIVLSTSPPPSFF
ncbi:12589_t:CDS:2 [Ambispora leptoticha]|uniref:12589_t:CDS:1 n=1 Tax=Ambispora leptoticha TaxID=144679 RepID=A0A9N9HKJ8_9GLOM|nr:12589_t:CDS:2 [Ambispora leptoticha]